MRYAIDFSESLPLLNNPKLDAFSNQIREEINPEYYLADLVKKGVEFKNLIGRVGRIKYNLYGNVFLVVEKEAKPKTEEKYKELVTKESEKQKLSIDECLTKPIKEKIVSSLLTGSTLLAKDDFGKKCTE